MITANLVLGFGEAGRSQEFFDGKMRKLYNLRIPDIDDGKQAGASR
jgi:hypothetical protein